MVTDNLNGVFVSTNSTVTAKTPELTSDGTGSRCIGSGYFLEREAGNVVYDTDCEVVLGSVCDEVVEYSEDGLRRSILGTETVTSANNLDVTSSCESKSGNNVEIKGIFS